MKPACDQAGQLSRELVGGKACSLRCFSFLNPKSQCLPPPSTKCQILIIVLFLMGFSIHICHCFGSPSASIHNLPDTSGRSQCGSRRFRPGGDRHVPDAGVCGVLERVRGHRNAAFNPQVRPRVPPRVHRRVATFPHHLPRVSRQTHPCFGQHQWRNAMLILL